MPAPAEQALHILTPLLPVCRAVPCCVVLLCVPQPPELHPYNFPELMIAPLSPLTEHDHQVGSCVLLGLSTCS
jgi:hypothetical protein